MDVFTVGEALSCFSPVEGRLADSRLVDKSVGGAEFNTAVGLARLGNSVCWCSRLGADPFGDDILQRAQHEGIVTDHVLRPPGSSTGLMFKDRSDPLEATTYYYRRGSAAAGMSVEDLPAEMTSAKHFHVTGVSIWIGPQTEALVWRAIETAVNSGMSVSFDPNFRPQLATIGHMRETSLRALACTSSFLCNELEAASITGLADPVAAAASLSRLGPRAVIVKRGIDGVVAVIDGVTHVLPAWPVPIPVDTVGAGDAFNAGWIHSQLRNLDPRLGLALSAYVAAQVVSHESDHGGFPFRAAVDAWLSDQLANPTSSHRADGDIMTTDATELGADTAADVAAIRDLRAVIARARILPVLRAKTREQLETQTAMCLEAGMTVMELTTTSPGWREVLTSLNARPAAADLIVGVGTITSPSLAHSALAAGANFLVTPYRVDGLEVPDDVPVVRGAFSPTELAVATHDGRIGKLFPAATLGPSYLRAVLEVLAGATVIPTGGIDRESARRWLDAGAVAVGMGSKLFDHGLDGLRALREELQS